MEDNLYSADRIEGDFVVLENLKTGEITPVRRELINCKEGDIIAFENGEFHKDEKATELRFERIKKLALSLWK